MRNSVYILLLMLGTLSFACTEALAAGDVGSEDQTMTIYFGGTGMKEGFWDGSKPPFKRPETVATLHYLHDVDNYPNQHKGFVNGPIAVAEWTKKTREAIILWNQKKDEGAFDNCEGKCVTLNLVGFSRGAVSTMHMAYEITNKEANKYIRDRIKKINILVFDPVPGDIFAPSFVCNLPHNVEYLGFYSVDERSYAFAPVFPNGPKDPPYDTDILFFTVPGSHETMIGSTRERGHWFGPTDDEHLGPVSRTLRIVATEIMGSSDWGHVRFEPKDGLDLDWYEDTADIILLQQWFEEDLEAMYASPLPSDYYQNMHNFSFIVALEAFGGTDSSCQAAGGPFISTHNPRCAFFRPYFAFPDGYTGIIGEANYYIHDTEISIPAARLNIQSDGEYDVWKYILEHGSLDVDADLVDYSQDNCPITYNPNQEDSDGDGEGDACDPVADANGPYKSECEGTTTTVFLDGSGSSDPLDGDSTYFWTTNCPGGSFNDHYSVTPELTVDMSIGCAVECAVELTVTNELGNEDIATAAVNIDDTEPPDIFSVSANPKTLWLPNHKMIPVTVEVEAEDDCDPEPPVCNIISVESNEPEIGNGSGNTAPDWEITGDLEVKLRAERAGRGSGREYVITVECADKCNNSVTEETIVTVSHDKGKKER